MGFIYPVGGRRAPQEMHGDALFPGELLDEICWVGWVGRILERLGTWTSKNSLSRNLWSSFLLE